MCSGWQGRKRNGLKRWLGAFSLEKDFREQIFGKVPHERGTILVQSDTHKAEMGLMRGHYRAAPHREKLSHLVCTWKAPSTQACSGEARPGSSLAGMLREVMTALRRVRRK